MILLLALLIPIVVSFFAYFAANKQITARELAAELTAVGAIIGITYLCMLSGASSDTELWNGSIKEKHAEWGSCCHSYSCHCYTTCSSKGSCTEHCSTCYRHSRDKEWYASSTTGKTVFSDTCNSPGSSTPSRWDHIYVGEPTTETRSFTNYIKANQGTLFRREGVNESLLAQVPYYPDVYDLYNSDRFVSLGVQGVNVAALNHELSFINAQLGAKKQVNIIVIVTKEADPMFAEALRQKWLGGKKNDVIVLAGMPSFPSIAWVSVISWTQKDDMKIRIRDNILAMQTFDGHKVLGITAYEVDKGFSRRHWQDFDYLKAGVEPSGGEIIALFLIAFVFSVAVNIFTWKQDLFGEAFTNKRFR